MVPPGFPGSSEDSFSMNVAFREAQELFGENAGLYTGLALVFGIPDAIAGLVTKGSESTSVLLVSLVISALFGAVSEAAITLGALRRVKGQAVGNDVLSTALVYYVPVLIAFLLVSLATLLGFMLLILPGIFIAALLFLTIPAIIEEGPGGARGGIKGLERSIALGAGHRLEIFLMVFLYVALLLGVSLLLESLLSTAPVLAAFASWLALGVISAFGAVLAVTSYAQLRALGGDPIRRDTAPEPQ